jgi:hypothetical protein
MLTGAEAFGRGDVDRCLGGVGLLELVSWENEATDESLDMTLLDKALGDVPLACA